MLRSINSLVGCRIDATDGQMGTTHDLYFDDTTWMVRHLVVDTGTWLPGKKVPVSPLWAERILWGKREVHMDLIQAAIAATPEFDPSAPVNLD